MLLNILDLTKKLSRIVQLEFSVLSKIVLSTKEKSKSLVKLRRIPDFGLI